MKIALRISILFLTELMLGQSVPFYESYSWEEYPKYEVKDLTSEIKSLREKFVIEFFYTEDGSLTEYYLEHKALWLNSDDKIEDYNKIYLPYSSNSELIVNKARVINRNGKTIELDSSKIFVAKDEETGKNYKYFAFEGVEKGSIIEYYYVEKKYPVYKGTAFRLQGSYDKENVMFDLLSPENLFFEFKSYNGLPEVEKDTLVKGKLNWKLRIKEISGLEEEDQSPYQASRGMLVYKLDKNLKNNMSDISSYGIVSQNIHEYYYKAQSKKVDGSINKFIEQHIGGDKNLPMDEIIRTLDRAIKTQIYKSVGQGEELENLELILNKNVANATGLIKLYAAIFQHLDIDHEIVITCDRSEQKFDKEFEANNFLTDFLFYFPATNSYLSPTITNSRYGFPPGNLTDTYGLFIKEIKVGDFTSGLGRIKFIEPVKAEKTVDRMTIDVKFDDSDPVKNTVSLQRSFSGYYGMSIHPYMGLIKEMDRDELIENLAKTMNKNVDVTKKEVHNQGPENFGVKPLVFDIELESRSFTEKAGKKLLFKVGELIGQQIQMYQEKKRVLPLENEFMRSYYRTIKVQLPAGYKVVNLDDININNVYVEGGHEVLSFKSYYSLDGQTLTITADEHYKRNIIDTPIFEDFRRVINSAADFNKITLIIEPTEK
ncbi:protein of unknown function [Muriicola jejuensis]|uniref:DUF3857 domain-containing protein n=1 Tax=Muriicola jejuensis TaxID=504488 RepID=A0A6P0UF01_9FLAO|nr:DUF3857 domain-containing protein [Muriicola jejuensis]NER11587.1 DUF3857 domain-containing protein [Muriicola jejuensis]SMP19513.1 protein of unknown function [Muriicola jejuensis]